MNDLQLESIGQIAIVVKDVDRAAEFYEKQLRLPLLFKFPGLAFFRCGETRLMLAKAESPELDHPASILYFRVHDIERHHRELSHGGVDFVDPPHVVHRDDQHELWMCFFRDGEGNTLALMEERTKDE